jgi:putative ABC transport system permease protein
VVASLVPGPALAAAASLPALRRALRRPVAETLAGPATFGFGSGRLDRLVARSGLLSATGVPGSVRMGVRNVLRRKRRSTATIMRVAVAAGLAITFLALGQSVTAAISQTIGKLQFSFSAGEAGKGARSFTGQALRIATSTPGVTGAELIETSSVQYDGQTYLAWGLATHTLYSYRLSAGHRLTAADAAGSARVSIPPVVLGPALARTTGAKVGQLLSFAMAAGPTRVRVVGIDTGEISAGQIVYFPLPLLERLDGVGYPASTTANYVTQAQITAADTSILTIVEILGLVVVAIMLMGLVSALNACRRQ